jgi:hypothetical protein
MPWPTFRKMNDHDLRAIYEYLSAIPSIERQDGVPGPCHGPDLNFQHREFSLTLRKVRDLGWPNSSTR